MLINKIPPVRARSRPSFFSKGVGSGFTLIEVLVVLIIVAIITAVAVMAFGQFGRGRREKIIADQFARVITIAQQQAILTPTVLGLGVSAKGYQFYQLEISLTSKKQNWQPLRNDVLSNKNAFKNVFDADVKSISASESKDNNNVSPRILFLPSGFVTPFVLELNGAKNHFVITVKNNGVVNVTSPG